jgi:hypothetical protein
VVHVTPALVRVAGTLMGPAGVLATVKESSALARDAAQTLAVGRDTSTVGSSVMVRLLAPLPVPAHRALSPGFWMPVAVSSNETTPRGHPAGTGLAHT